MNLWLCRDTGGTYLTDRRPFWDARIDRFVFRVKPFAVDFDEIEIGECRRVEGFRLEKV